MDFLTLEQPVWTRLQAETRPVVLYGMGDGADKILDRFAQLGIAAAGVFASDEFVRGTASAASGCRNCPRWWSSSGKIS